MKISRKFVLLLMVAILSLALSISAYAKVITYTPDNTATKTTTERTVSVSSKSVKGSNNSGPGAEPTIQMEEEVVFTGPSVKKVSLSETYHELYDTYEEAIADTYFLYANVSNGGLTHEPVAVDIPANVEYSMEKDGLPVSYVSRQFVSEKGTYVLRLTAVEDPNLPFSEQTEYQALFRFRIQDEPPKAAEETTSVSSGSTGGAIWDNPAINVIPSDVQVDVSKLLEETTQAETEAVVVETTPAETPAETETVPEETTPVETSAAIETEAVETEPAKTEPTAESSAAASGTRQQTFHPETGLYTIVLENGMQMMINVEDGYKGEGPVEFTVAEEDLSMTALYRGNDRITLNNNSRTITDHGKYKIAMTDEDGVISYVQVTIPYQMNFYAVLAVVLCALVIVGVVVFIIITKKNFKIR